MLTLKIMTVENLETSLPFRSLQGEVPEEVPVQRRRCEKVTSCTDRFIE
jgi:hypothetical protein